MARTRACPVVGSIIIALGHLSIALSAMFGMTLFFVGLICIVLGSGLFKTVSQSWSARYILG